MKRCSQCGEEKPVEQFSRKKSHADGLCGSCKACQAASGLIYRAAHPEMNALRSAAWRDANPQKAAASDAAYRAANHEKVLAREAAYRAANGSRRKEMQAAYYAVNREKSAKRSAAYRAANPERCLSYKHARRAKQRAAGGTYTVTDLADIRRMQGGRCANSIDPKCNDPKLKGKVHIDHIIPIAKGGSNDRRNIQIMCEGCNFRKHARDPIEFAQLSGRLI